MGCDAGGCKELPKARVLTHVKAWVRRIVEYPAV